MGSLHVNASLGGRQLGFAALVVKSRYTLLQDEATSRGSGVAKSDGGVKRNDGGGASRCSQRPRAWSSETERKHRARKPVPSRSPSAVRYGMEKLSGSRLRLHISRMMRSAT